MERQITNHARDRRFQVTPFIPVLGTVPGNHGLGCLPVPFDNALLKGNDRIGFDDRFPRRECLQGSLGFIQTIVRLAALQESLD